MNDLQTTVEQVLREHEDSRDSDFRVIRLGNQGNQTRPLENAARVRPVELQETRAAVL